jgi:hypothetical protein
MEGKPTLSGAIDRKYHKSHIDASSVSLKASRFRLKFADV